MKDCQNKVTRLINKLSKPKGIIDGKLREIQGRVSGSQAKLPFYFSPHSLFSLFFFKQTTPPNKTPCGAQRKTQRKTRKAKVLNLLSLCDSPKEKGPPLFWLSSQKISPRPTPLQSVLTAFIAVPIE